MAEGMQSDRLFEALWQGEASAALSLCSRPDEEIGKLLEYQVPEKDSWNAVHLAVALAGDRVSWSWQLGNVHVHLLFLMSASHCRRSTFALIW